MGHVNGGIFSKDNNGVTVGINTDDVAAVLGLSSHDVGTLCSSGKINPWARFKPVAWHSPDKNAPHPTYPTRPWWKGNDNQCGLTPPPIYTGSGATALALMANALNGGAPVWKYNPPGPNDWKSMDMFDEYIDDAVCPFGELSRWRRQEELTNTSETIHRFYIPEPAELIGTEDWNLTTEDIAVVGINGLGFGQCYLGIMFLNETGTGYIAATSAKKLGSTDTVSFNADGASRVKEGRTIIFRRRTNIGRKRMYLFMSPEPITHSETNGYGYPSAACPIMPLNGPFVGTF